MDLTILRLTDDGTETQGVFVAAGKAFAVSLERPWLDNKPEISCIPAGTYLCKRRWSDHFQREVFEISDVPGRTNILIHPANLVTQLEGCVAIAEKYMGDQVQESGEAFEKLMTMFKDKDSFWVSIVDVNKYLPTTG